MTWSVQQGWAGTYRYTFKLTLDNHDGTWRTGQGFGWIVFGDNGSALSQLDDFAADSAGFPVGPWTAVTKTAGASNGPTLSFARNTWTPTAVGESLVWTGTASKQVGSAQMKWTALVTSGGAKQISMEPATQVSPCMADVNGDGFVDGIDYDLFNLAFETGNASADVNHDGFVDGIDYDGFNREFEAGC
jgi:hypothetical protein